MKTLQQIAECGARACAYKMYTEGQGQESNPYPKGSDAHEEFYQEMRRHEQNEFIEMMGGNYAS